MDPVFFGTYHGCQNCVSGHAEASDVPHHLAKMLLSILMSIQTEQFSAPYATSCTS